MHGSVIRQIGKQYQREGQRKARTVPASLRGRRKPIGRRESGTRVRGVAPTRSRLPMKKFPTFLKAASYHLVTIGWLLPPGTAAGVAKAWRAIPSIPQQTAPKRAKTARTAKPIYCRAARPLSRENHSTCIMFSRTPWFLELLI